MAKIETMTDEQKLKALLDLSKSKWWAIVREALINKRNNSALAIIQRQWQSEKELSIDDMYKKSISIYQSIMSFVEDNIKQLQDKIILDWTEKDAEINVWDVDDLFKTSM